MGVATEPPPDLTGYDDADLLELIACRDGAGEDEVCRAAFVVLYDRHAPRLNRNLEHFDNLLGGPRGREDLIQDVFLKVLAGAASKFKKVPGDPPLTIELKVAAWLHTIAKRLLLSHNAHELSVVPLSEEFVAVTESDDIEQFPTPVLERFRHCFDALPPDQRDALLLIYNEIDPAAKMTRLPNGVAEEIARTLGTTKVALRQRRSRAERALEECCGGANLP